MSSSPIKNAAGFTIVEVLIASVSMIVILGSTAVMLGSYSNFENSPNAKAMMVQAMAEVKRMLDVDNPTFGVNLACSSAFGVGTAIDPANPASYNLYNSDGSVKFYGSPSSSQNHITPQWRITSVQLIPFGTSTNYNRNQYLLFASLTLTAAPLQGTDSAAPESIPLIFVLRNGTNTIVGCSSASSNREYVVRLPTCNPTQHLFYVQVAAGQQPSWVCQ